VKITHVFLSTGEGFFDRFPQFQGKVLNANLCPIVWKSLLPFRYLLLLIVINKRCGVKPILISHAQTKKVRLGRSLCLTSATHSRNSRTTRRVR
jgi:hypothetical protein